MTDTTATHDVEREKQRLREYRDTNFDAYTLKTSVRDLLSEENGDNGEVRLPPVEITRIVEEWQDKRTLVEPENVREWLLKRGKDYSGDRQLFDYLRKLADASAKYTVDDSTIHSVIAEIQGSGDEKPKMSSRLTRTGLGDALRNGVPEPEVLEPDVLIKGAVHQIFTGPEQGKTWVALWLIKNAMERGETPVFMDMENGQRIIAERLQALGVDAHEVDERLHYFYLPALDMQPEARTEYEALLDEVHPDLIIFDSWIGFLARCGFDENSPTHVEQWANAYVQSAKDRGCTVVILDHVPHDATRSRGATRKTDLVDVQWHLKKVQHFDRDAVGYIQLTRRKDREAWLPQHVGISIGGTQEGFIMERSTGTFDDTGDGLTKAARVAAEALDTFGSSGATFKEWHQSTVWKDGKPMPETTFRRARSQLVDTVRRVIQVDDRYYSHYSQSTATAVTAVGQTLPPTTATPYRVAAVAVDDGASIVDVMGNGSAPPPHVLEGQDDLKAWIDTMYTHDDYKEG